MKYIIISLLLLATSCMNKPFHEGVKDIEFVPQKRKGLNGKIDLAIKLNILFQNMIYETGTRKIEVYSPNTFEIDEELSEAISFNVETDSDVEIRNYKDTLFAFIDSSALKWNTIQKKWSATENKFKCASSPRFLFSDSRYEFYYLDQGEWGRYVFIEDKTTDKTHYFHVDRKVLQIYRENNSYYFILTPYYGMYSEPTSNSTIMEIRKIDSLPLYTPQSFKNYQQVISLDTQIEQKYIEVVDSSSNIFAVFDTGREKIKLLALKDTVINKRYYREVYFCDSNGKPLDYPYKDLPLRIFQFGSLSWGTYIQEFADYYIMEVGYKDMICFVKIHKVKDQ